MRVSLVITSDGWGGAEEFVYQLAKSLSKSGHNVTIMGNSEVIGYYNDLRDDVKIIDLGKLFEPPSVRRLPFLRALFRHFNAVRISKRLTEELYKEKPDVIHFNQPSVLLLWAYTFKFIRGNIPVVYTAHGLDFEMNHAINTLFPPSLVRKLIESFDIVITPSKFMLRELKKKGVVANIAHIPNGILYLEYREILNEISKKKICKKRMYILFPGGGKLFKGGSKVLEAIYYLKKKNKTSGLLFSFSGRIQRGHVYFDLIRKYGIKDEVKIIGFLPHKQHNYLMAVSDVLILPSEYENFPIVLLEAMALGKPIIATNLGGIPEVVEDKHNGYLCDGSPKELARLIEFLYENPKIRKKISRINPQRAKRFEWNAIADMYLNAYRSIAGGSEGENSILQTLV